MKITCNIQRISTVPGAQQTTATVTWDSDERIGTFIDLAGAIGRTYTYDEPMLRRALVAEANLIGRHNVRFVLYMPGDPMPHFYYPRGSKHAPAGTEGGQWSEVMRKTL